MNDEEYELIDPDFAGDGDKDPDSALTERFPLEEKRKKAA